MSGDQQPVSGAGEAKPQKTKAEDNPWYLLATLYGVGQHDKNRRAWNRYFSASLDEETRAKLVEEKRHPAEELRLFSSEEFQEVATAFAERAQVSTKNLLIPKPNEVIDFSNVQFDQGVSFHKYLFGPCSFEEATFSARAIFARVSFSGYAQFKGVTFCGLAAFFDASFGYAFFNGAIFSKKKAEERADFRKAKFSGDADFSGATFYGEAVFDRSTFSGETKFDGRAEFRGLSSFVNAKMEGKTSFEGTTFKSKPPQFFGAGLHEGTVWPALKTWPVPRAYPY